MLSPETVAAIEHGINARMLTEAHDLDRNELNRWLDQLPAADYCRGLLVHAHILATRPALAARASR